MKNRKNSDFGWIFFLIFFLGGGTFIPMLIIVGIVFAIVMAAVNASKRNEQRSNPYASYSSSTYYAGNRTSNISASQMAKNNIFLRKWFRTHTALNVSTGIELRVRNGEYKSLSNLDVYRNGILVSGLNVFGANYPESYEQILREVSKQADDYQNTDVIDVQATPTNVKKEEVKVEEPSSSAQSYIDQINALNDAIPDEEISNGLFETCALLKQAQKLETTFPASKGKLKKLYEYYLPILVRILKQYDALQTAQTDPNYEETKEKLGKTVVLINDAMKNMIASYTDQDFINLSADMATLNAVLKKDGLTSDGMFEVGHKGDE